MTEPAADRTASDELAVLLEANAASTTRAIERAVTLVNDQSPFWLDIEQPTDDTIDLLTHTLDLHRLAADDATTFGRRAAVDNYGDVTIMIGFGVDPTAIQPVEVHAFLTSRCLVTLHQAPCPTLNRLRDSGDIEPLLGGDPVRLLHAVASALHDEYPPCIDRLDERLGALASEIIRAPADRHLIEIAELNETAATLRRTLAPGRGLAAHVGMIERLPGASEASTPYINDIADDLHQIIGDLEALEERCLSMLGLHASLASNRLSAASRQLAIVATIFLPLTFLVGFFGQNFSVLINTMQQGWLSFLLLGVGLGAASVMATAALLNRRGLR